MHAELAGKRLELLHELVPSASAAALLVNRRNPVTEQETMKFQEAAGSLGLQTHVIRAGTPSEIDAAFETVVGLGAKGLVISGDSLFTSQRARKSFRWRRATPYRPSMCGGCSPRRRADELRVRLRRKLSPAGSLRRQDPQRCEARRFAGPADRRSGAGDKPQNCQNAQAHHPADAGRPCRRSD